MQKACWYCHKPLSLFKSFKGELFCDPEHEKLYLSDQFKRVQDPFAAKAPPAKAEPEPTPEPVVETAPVEAAKVVEVPVAEVPVIKPVPEEVLPAAEVVTAPVERAAVVEPPPVSAAAEATPEPPVAPLFAWPVTAREGTRREPVLEQAVDLVPARVNASRSSEPVESRNTLPVAPLLAMSLGTLVVKFETAVQKAVSGEAIAVAGELVRPRMGDHSCLAVDDFPTASSVATPLRASEGTTPWVFPQDAIDLGPARVDPTRKRQATPALGFAMRSRLELRAQHPASDAEAVHEPSLPSGFSKVELLNTGLLNTGLEKQVPGRLSFGAAAQPEQTPAVSGQLEPVDSLRFETGITPGGAIGSPMEPRLPQFAALGLESAVNWTASPAFFVPAGTGQHAHEQIALGSLLHQSVPLTLASVVKIERSGAVADAARLIPTGFFAQGSSEASEFRAESLSPESALVSAALVVDREPSKTLGNIATLAPAEFFTPDFGKPREIRVGIPSMEAVLVRTPPHPVAGLVRDLTPATPRRTHSYGVIAEMSTCAGTAFAGSQKPDHAAEVARDFSKAQLTTAGMRFGGSAQLSRQGHLHGPSWSGQDLTLGRLPAVESAPRPAAATQFPQVRPSTVSFGLGAARVPEQGLAGSPRVNLLSASAQTTQPLDSRLPNNRGSLAGPRLKTGLAALQVRPKDSRAKAIKTVGRLETVAGTSLPAVSITVVLPALRESLAAAISNGAVAAGLVPDFSGQLKQRKVISASLLGLPGTVLRNVVLYPGRGEAFEMPLASANQEPSSGVNMSSPVTGTATKQIAEARVTLADPALQTHSVILNFIPIPGDAPAGTYLAQAQPRRRSPAALLAGPRAGALQGSDRFAAPEPVLQGTSRSASPGAQFPRTRIVVQTAQ